ncbi:MAG TPA: FAD-dependent oxidoreductase, partial [Streptosporangiaceae bacterium]|nr:FAD-dependent oxidoreductase [Streptosporangiaceae bacterium]
MNPASTAGTSTAGTSTAGPRRIVVVGGGLAGLRTVEELRAGGYAGAVTLVGAEDRPPYDRPPLSKRLMTGQLDDTTLRDDMDSLGLELRLGETATGLDDGVLRTDSGEHRFDRLVLATGATPVRLPGPGAQRFLRTMEDALALRALLRPGLRLAIVGAGWIGAELATAAAAKGCRVTVVEAAATPLAAALGAEIGGLTAGWYAAAGVELFLDQAVESVQPGGLALAGGGWLPADEVVTAVGVRPATGWLQGSGVALENGVAADEQLRTSLPGVFAVGDCAAFWSLRYRRRLRFEHWDVALRAPTVVAANLVGAGEPYDPVPYFWSEQFGRMVQYAGHHGDADRMLLRGDPAAPRWGACWLAGDALIAVLAVDSPRDLAQGRRLIEARIPVDAARLADPA